MSEWLMEPIETARWYYALNGAAIALLIVMWGDERRARKRLQHADLILRRILNKREPDVGWLEEGEQ